MKKPTIFLPLLVLALVSPQASLLAETLQGAVNRIATDMIHGYKIEPPKNNVAVMQFVAVSGPKRALGDWLMRKVRISMFEQDKARSLKFVSQGRVTDIIVKEGLKSLNEIYDDAQRAKLGKLLTTDYFVHGSYELNPDGTVEIVAFLSDIEKGITRAQSVQKVTDAPAYLLAVVGAGGGTLSYNRISGRKLASDPKAAKKYRMAGIFHKRGRTERSRKIYEGIIADYPDSVEAMYSQLQLMSRDLEALQGAGTYNEGLYQVVATFPERYKRLSLYQKVQADTIGWLVGLGKAALDENGQEAKAKGYFDKAKNLGLSPDALKELNDQVTAALIRRNMRLGNRDEAELQLVEWEADDPDSTVLAALKKEFERPKGMVTIPSGVVYGKDVSSFNLDIYETTNAEFLNFVKANPSFRQSKMTRDRNDKDYLDRWGDDFKYADGAGNIPVVFVSQIVAQAYCKWRGKRLPTSDEWSLAAGEGKRKYPWGDRQPNKNLANYGKGLLGDPLPGDSHPLGRTPEGVYHMAGNVWELTSTTVKREAVARGGCYYDDAKILRNSNRDLSADPIVYSSRFMGFRCAQ